MFNPLSGVKGNNAIDLIRNGKSAYFDAIGDADTANSIRSSTDAAGLAKASYAGKLGLKAAYVNQSLGGGGGAEDFWLKGEDNKGYTQDDKGWRNAGGTYVSDQWMNDPSTGQRRRANYLGDPSDGRTELHAGPNGGSIYQLPEVDLASVAGTAASGQTPRRTLGYAAGTPRVPGQDTGEDTVPAMLRPNEAVLTPEAADAVGRDKIAELNAQPARRTLGERTNPALRMQAARQRREAAGPVLEGSYGVVEGPQVIPKDQPHPYNTALLRTLGRGEDAPAAATPYDANLPQMMAAAPPRRALSFNTPAHAGANHTESFTAPTAVVAPAKAPVSSVAPKSVAAAAGTVKTAVDYARDSKAEAGRRGLTNVAVMSNGAYENEGGIVTGRSTGQAGTGPKGQRNMVGIGNADVMQRENERVARVKAETNEGARLLDSVLERDYKDPGAIARNFAYTKEANDLAEKRILGENAKAVRGDAATKAAVEREEKNMASLAGYKPYPETKDDNGEGATKNALFQRRLFDWLGKTPANTKWSATASPTQIEAFKASLLRGDDLTNADDKNASPFFGAPQENSSFVGIEPGTVQTIFGPDEARTTSLNTAAPRTLATGARGKYDPTLDAGIRRSMKKESN